MIIARRTGFRFATIGQRNLFNDKFLGLDNFKEKKESMTSSEKDKIKLHVKNINDAHKRLLTKDIKKFIYCIDTEEDLELAQNIITKFCSGGNSLLFGNFSLDPEIMRMYHVLNKPHEAVNVLKDNKAQALFSNIKSYVILQDLLYKNKLYEEVCEIYKFVTEKQFSRRKFPFLNYILYQAACYKMNTENSFKDVMKAYREFMDYYQSPVWPILLYTMIFALENKVPAPVLENAVGEDSISSNLKLFAYVKTDLLKAVNHFHCIADKSQILKSVAEIFCQELQKTNEKSDKFIKTYEYFRSQIDAGTMLDKTLDELAAETFMNFNGIKGIHFD